MKMLGDDCSLLGCITDVEIRDIVPESYFLPPILVQRWYHWQRHCFQTNSKTAQFCPAIVNSFHQNQSLGIPSGVVTATFMISERSHYCNSNS